MLMKTQFLVSGDYTLMNTQLCTLWMADISAAVWYNMIFALLHRPHVASSFLEVQ